MTDLCRACLEQTRVTISSVKCNFLSVVFIFVAVLFGAPTVQAAALDAYVLGTTTATSTGEIKEVALTFDDGPYGTSTSQVLDILHGEGVHASFFLVGKNVEKYPELARRIAQRGDVIGNHTYDHTKHLATMSLKQMRIELLKTDRAIASTTGIHTKLFRPPYGILSPKLKQELHRQGYTIVMWNVDPRDWDYASSTSEVIVQHVLTHLKPHMNILLHDGRDTHENYPRDNLVEALPVLIQDLKSLGYVFVTVPELNK